MRHRGVDAADTDIRGDDRIDHTLDRPRGRQVDGCQTGVWVLAAGEGDVQLARQLEVFDEAGLTAQQTRILHPPQRGAHKRHVTHECNGLAPQS
jgi:hypothetical protein